MAIVLEQYLDRLRAAGLLISEPFVPTHVAHPDAVIVCKPTLVAGHSLPEYEGWWCDSVCDNVIMLDAPTMILHYDGLKWFVISHDYIPGPGPGDFVNEWTTPEEAIADILDFYFGSSERMDVKRQARAEFR